MNNSRPMFEVLSRIISINTEFDRQKRLRQEELKELRQLARTLTDGLGERYMHAATSAKVSNHKDFPAWLIGRMVGDEQTLSREFVLHIADSVTHRWISLAWGDVMFEEKDVILYIKDARRHFGKK